jgi:hypothetical protein
VVRFKSLEEDIKSSNWISGIPVIKDDLVNIQEAGKLNDLSSYKVAILHIITVT